MVGKLRRKTGQVYTSGLIQERKKENDAQLKRVRAAAMGGSTRREANGEARWTRSGVDPTIEFRAGSATLAALHE
jgi:hypothetical protein